MYEHCQEPCANQVPKIPGQLELIWILELHPVLTHLCLDNYIISSDYAASFFIRAVPRLTRLQDLDVYLQSCVLTWPDMVQALFCNLLLTLKNFRLCCLNDSNRHHPLTFAPGCEDLQLPTLPESEAPPTVRRNGPLTSLKKLQFELDIDQHVGVLDRIVALCPALEILTPPRCLKADCRSLAKAIVQNCPRLQELNNSGNCSLAIANELPAHSLEIIHGQNYEQANMVLMTISARHFDGIREIRVPYPHINGPVIQKVLSSCRVLEHLTLGKGF
ncbi:hypothetical protein BGZ90_002269 [Linnemannia elongata]|nr:hypothetical protein BGZ90_002269 [Linnemannia elongata]